MEELLEIIKTLGSVTHVRGSFELLREVAEFHRTIEEGYGLLGEILSSFIKFCNHPSIENLLMPTSIIIKYFDEQKLTHEEYVEYMQLMRNCIVKVYSIDLQRL